MKIIKSLISSLWLIAIALAFATSASADTLTVSSLGGVTSNSGYGSFGSYPTTFGTGVTNNAVMVDNLANGPFMGLSAVYADNTPLANDGHGTYFVNKGVPWYIQSSFMFKPLDATLNYYWDIDPSANLTLSNSIGIGIPWDYAIPPGIFSSGIDYTELGTWTFAESSTNSNGFLTDVDHISVVVQEVTSSKVPDGGSVALMMGSAMLGLFGYSYRYTKGRPLAQVASTS